MPLEVETQTRDAVVFANRASKDAKIRACAAVAGGIPEHAAGGADSFASEQLWGKALRGRLFLQRAHIHVLCLAYMYFLCWEQGLRAVFK